MTKCDVAIIGAGPYGLSATAHLRTVKGLDVHTFGEPMSFWEGNMPKGMLLRSGWAASHIAGPNESLTMEEYQAEAALIFPAPYHSTTSWATDTGINAKLCPTSISGRLRASSPCQTALSLSSKRVRLSMHAAWSLPPALVRLLTARQNLQVC